MSGDSQVPIIVSSTINLAHHLGLRAVAEGVEDMMLLPRLEELRCDFAQGFGIGRPMPAADLTRGWRRARERRPERSLVQAA